MPTLQANVYKPGTYENEIASLISEMMGENQNPMSQLLRRILFANPIEGDNAHNIDWEMVAYYMGTYFPERAEKINAIKIKYGK